MASSEPAPAKVTPQVLVLVRCSVSLHDSVCVVLIAYSRSSCIAWAVWNRTIFCRLRQVLLCATAHDAGALLLIKRCWKHRIPLPFFLSVLF